MTTGLPSSPASAVSERIPRDALFCLLRSGSRKRVRERIRRAGSLAQAAAQAPAYAGLQQDLAAAQALTVVQPGDAEFPEVLAAIPDPPLALFVDGNVAALHAPMVAVVGARRASRSGTEFARRLSAQLVEAGLVVASGLAFGVDAAAHRGALDVAASLATVAVLGSGHASLYPAAHGRLAEQIVERGAVVSEYLPNTPPAKPRFPERNRLVSGLSAAVVVVEAGERSGSLITARLALEQGRDVLAVPGPPGSALASGCHRLIRSGAALVTEIEHVLAELPPWIRPDSAVKAGEVEAPGSPEHEAEASERLDSSEAAPPLDSQAAAVLACVDALDTPLQTICARCGLTPDTVLSRLTELELDGLVRSGARGYSRRPFH